MRDGAFELKNKRITDCRFTGAWMTDIDDTIIKSGEMPDENWVKWISSKIEKLNSHNILWIPMSGVALVKLGPRILYRLPENILDSVLYYGGDGSQKYYYDKASGKWEEDLDYKRVFTDEQALAVIGKEEFLKTVHDKGRYEKAASALAAGGFKAEEGILDTMKKMLSDNGYDPGLSETYFRGGSVSWMMLGDISADPYKTEKAARVREKLIEYAEKTLEKEGFLKRFGKEGINIPFHGARGIKFVMMGNDKERGTRDLVEKEGIKPENIVFAGNELFAGGNDNMIRKVKGVTILSVGEKTDPGEHVIAAGEGIEANNLWLDRICGLLDKGEKWEDIFAAIRTQGKNWIGNKL